MKLTKDQAKAIAIVIIIGWLGTAILFGYAGGVAMEEIGGLEGYGAAMICFDAAIWSMLVFCFAACNATNSAHRKKILDLQLQIEELMERLDDVDGIVNHMKLSVNPRYIGQDTSRPSAPEAQDDGRDAEDHAA